MSEALPLTAASKSQPAKNDQKVESVIFKDFYEHNFHLSRWLLFKTFLIQTKRFIADFHKGIFPRDPFWPKNDSSEDTKFLIIFSA